MQSIADASLGRPGDTASKHVHGLMVTPAKRSSHPTETGMARLSLNDADKQVRDWFRATVESLGCEYSFDQMGNQFAIRAGKNKTAPPVMMGSHLDTQPTGGRYDGILGVNAGLEVLKVLNDNNVETEGSIGVVNWTKYALICCCATERC